MIEVLPILFILVYILTKSPIDTCLTNINALSLKTYNYLDTTITDRTVYGFLAQEVKNVIPAAVYETKGKLPDGTIVNDFHYLSKDRIFTEMVGAVQKLSQKVDDLTTRIQTLEGN